MKIGVLKMTRTSSDIVCKMYPTTLGEVLLAANSQGLVGVWFDKQHHFPNTTGWQGVQAHGLLRETHAQIEQYLNGQRQRFDLPLALVSCTPFQLRVWEALQAIPYGQTTHYGHIAQQVGSPAAVRAVGAAIGRNPLIMVIPCHRVLGAKGALTGYAGGLARKHTLLALEAAHT
jgi:methylated-DNA-[protein]-cysteine S-methyltransferase